MLKNYGTQDYKKSESWLGRFNPLYMLLAMIIAKLFDTITAYAAYLWNPANFAKLEQNEITKNAFLYGERLPFLMSLTVIFLGFGFVTYYLSKQRGRQGISLGTLAIAALGILSMCIFPIGAATNIILGIFMLQLTPLESGIGYVVIAPPIAWMLTRYGWGVKDLRVLAFMLATIVFMSFIMFARVI